MIKNFLIISFIGDNDKLGLRINKEFFIHNLIKKKTIVKTCEMKYHEFLNKHNVNAR